MEFQSFFLLSFFLPECTYQVWILDVGYVACFLFLPLRPFCPYPAHKGPPSHGVGLFCMRHCRTLICSPFMGAVLCPCICCLLCAGGLCLHDALKLREWGSAMQMWLWGSLSLRPPTSWAVLWQFNQWVLRLLASVVYGFIQILVALYASQISFVFLPFYMPSHLWRRTRITSWCGPSMITVSMPQILFDPLPFHTSSP